MDGKQPWVELPPGVLQYEQGIGDNAEVARAWETRGDTT
jgi:hypothetical protein